MANYLFVDFYSSSNRGDAAILEGMKADFTAVDPSARIHVLAYHTASVRHINRMEAGSPLVPSMALSFRLLAYVAALRLVGTRFKEWVMSRLPRSRGDAIEKYFWADLIVSVGGAHLNDNYSKDLLSRLIGLWFAKLLGKKVLIYCQSIGPFHRASYRMLARRVLDRADLIVLREQESCAHLRNARIRRPPVKVTTDAAFSLRPTEAAFNESSSYVTLSIREWPYDSYGQALRITIAEYVDWLVAELNLKVRFVSTCTGFGGYHADDRIVGLDIGDLLTPDGAASYVVAMEEMSPYALMNVYAGALFHVGMRMHSCILAFNAGTPFIPLSYEHKTHGMAQQTGFREFLVEARNVRMESLKADTLSLIGNNDLYRQMIATKASDIRSLAETNRTLIRSLIR